MPGAVLSVLFASSHEVGTMICLHLTGDRTKVSSGLLAPKSMLSSYLCLPTQMCPPPQSFPLSKCRSPDLAWCSGGTERGGEFHRCKRFLFRGSAS